MNDAEKWTWVIIGIVLCTLAIPWFLWGNTTVVFGFPLWLWWHIGWMLLASVVFFVFAERAWGVGIDPERDDSSRGKAEPNSRPDGGEW